MSHNRARCASFGSSADCFSGTQSALQSLVAPYRGRAGPTYEVPCRQTAPYWESVNDDGHFSDGDGLGGSRSLRDQ